MPRSGCFDTQSPYPQANPTSAKERARWERIVLQEFSKKLPDPRDRIGAMRNNATSAHSPSFHPPTNEGADIRAVTRGLFPDPGPPGRHQTHTKIIPDNSSLSSGSIVTPGQPNVKTPLVTISTTPSNRPSQRSFFRFTFSRQKSGSSRAG